MGKVRKIKTKFEPKSSSTSELLTIAETADGMINILMNRSEAITAGSMIGEIESEAADKKQAIIQKFLDEYGALYTAAKEELGTRIKKKAKLSRGPHEIERIWDRWGEETPFLTKTPQQMSAQFEAYRQNLVNEGKDVSGTDGSPDGADS